MLLFDKGRRSRREPALYNESYFSFLNRVDGIYWQDLRDELETWFAQVPVGHQAALRGRMRSADHGFWGGFWELFLHQLFGHLGCETILEPDVDGEASADLLIEYEGCRHLVEATVLMEPESYAKSDSRWGVLLDALRELSSADFWLSLEVQAESPQQPAGRRLAQQMQEWVDGLTYRPPDAQANPSGNATATAIFTDRGWRIRVGATPKTPAHRAETRGIQMGPMRVRFVDDHLAMVNDLRQKAHKYRDSTLPLVLAVMNHRFTASERSDRLALYGPAWEYPDMMASSRINPTWRNAPEGLWVTRSGARNIHVEAVITASQVAPHSFPEAQPTVWHPPRAASDLESLALRHVVPQPNGTLRMQDATRSTRELFGLPTGWPRGQPFS